MRLRLFIDFWNFQLNWNDRGPGSHIDWQKVGPVLTQTANAQLVKMGLSAATLEEVRVYASYEPAKPGDLKLKNWLNSWLNHQPGFKVFTTERNWKQKAIHCRSCGVDTPACPACGAMFGRAAEKAIDSLIVTDLISLAWEGGYDIALLVSSDKDFVPAVKLLQTKTFKIINATWDSHGFELAGESWASFKLDELVPQLKRV